MAITRTGDDRFRPIRTPDTMKKVAATSGQRVNLAIAFFAVGSAWEGICAGSDTVLNFFSLPLGVTLTLDALERGRI